MFLNQQELIELTGRRQKAAQVKALRFMGIEHRIRPDGSVAVLEEHVKVVMGVVDSGATKAKREWVPDWGKHG